MVSRNKVTSVNSEDLLQYMRKLNKRKIRWIVREMGKEELSIYQIAKQQGISKMHAWRVFNRFKQVKTPILLKPGRPPTPLRYEEVELIAKLYEEFPMGSTKIEKHLQWKGMQHIPHNRIHLILKALGMAAGAICTGLRSSYLGQNSAQWSMTLNAFPGHTNVLSRHN